eukprot:TRINITY_DN3119_c0_g1_i3.p1 TRINITY_DN3119_c0_g1~~TRINITY_DN3119_c0_g1_i3.p1  ORF type:complete len:370 (+),score=73.34 TRINITY_DN3119_c0_g1_i3:129-1238(+)
MFVPSHNEKGRVGLKQGNDRDLWSGFYKKSLTSRQQQINEILPGTQKSEKLREEVADNMIENCIGTFSLPLGLGLNFLINNKQFVVPMVTEEPSVVAAVSGAAKTIAQNGGFFTSYTGNVMVCQIQLLDVPNVSEAAEVIRANEIDIIEHGNIYCESMKKRGGGVVKVVPRIVSFDKEKYFKVHTDDNGSLDEEFSFFDKEFKFASKDPITNLDINNKDRMLIVHLHVDVCEAMGANIVNTIAEGVSPLLIDLVGGRAGLRIISNYSVERRAKSTFRIPVEKLANKNKSGGEVCRGILEGYAMACSDLYRAVTHNKGIMNGIDAVAIALGQDSRAIESGAHAWASRNGTYQPLTHYRLVQVSEKNKNKC